jgi:A/G-specific adenine glycosylase
VDFDSVAALPGVGRSTAGAILALSQDQRHPIMDGNVRRVLSRLQALPGRSGERAFEQQLWQIAAEQTPAARVAQYTQAIMDLGATLCVRRQPRCGQCPLVEDCAAHAAGRVHDFPAPKKPLQRRRRELWMLLARGPDGSVRLVQRPPSGVWGGLWSPPEFTTRDDAAGAAPAGAALLEGEPVQHAFTHFDLTIRPLWASGGAAGAGVAEEAGSLWYNAARPALVGLPQPILQLLKNPP